MKLILSGYVKAFRRFEIISFPVFALVINRIYYGTEYLKSVSNFLLFNSIIIACFVPHIFLAHKLNAYFFKKWPGDANVLKSLLISIPFTIISSFILLYVMASICDWLHLYPYSQERFMWAFLAQAIINIFMGFMAVGFAQFSDWEKNYAETEALKNLYKISRLNGLKSQVNPHFLFNSLNSLSSLIQENEEEAEKFLDEMSKVYRYMLRNDEEQLITLETELQFAASYMHLLKTRYGAGLQLHTAIQEADKKKLLAPLTLQVFIENAFSQNVINKTNPLILSITTDGNGTLEVKNNLQRKVIMEAIDFEAGLDNLVKKYELLKLPLTVDDSNATYRIIQLSLLSKKEEAAA